MWNQSTKNINESLRYACLHNDVESVRRLCKLNANVEIEDSNCTTCLMLACYYGNYDVVLELISNQNVNINHGDIDDVSPIHYACEQQHLSIVKLLIEYNVDIHSQTRKNGWTPLHYASDSCNFDLVKLLLLNGADKQIKDNYNRTPYDIALKKKIADLRCLFQAESIDDIKTIHQRHHSTSHQRQHSSMNKKHSEQRSNLSAELEKERITRGEFSKLKDKINELQFENDKLLNRVSSIESNFEDVTMNIQSLSSSVHSILSLSPIHSIATTKVSLSSPPLNNPSFSKLSSSLKPNSIDKIVIPIPNKNSQSNKSLHHSSSHQHNQRLKNELSPSASISPSPSPGLMDTPMTDLNTPIINKNDLDTPNANIIPGAEPRDIDPDNENVTIGLNTEYEFDLEDDETKLNQPDFHKMPSLRPEANSLELGNESEYAGGYSTRASTPNKLPTITSPVTEFDPMTPIRETNNERNSNSDHQIISNNNSINNNKKPLKLQKNQSSPPVTSHFEFSIPSTDTTPLPTVDPGFKNKYHSSPQPYKYGARPSPLSPSPLSPSPWSDVRNQTVERNNYIPRKTANNNHYDHRRHQSEQLFPDQYNKYNHSGTDLIGGGGIGGISSYNYHNTKWNNNYVYSNPNFINQYMKNTKKVPSYNTETETETETDTDGIFPDTPKMTNSMPHSLRRKSTPVAVHPHIQIDDDDDDDDDQNYPDLDDINHRHLSAEIIPMDDEDDIDDNNHGENDVDNHIDGEMIDIGNEGSGASTNDHQEVEITAEEYAKLLGINQTPSPPMQPIAKPTPKSNHNPNSFVYVNNAKLGVPLNNDNNNNNNNNNNNSTMGIPSTIGIATGTISPNTVEAVSRATKHHETMANADFNKNYSFIRKTKVASIALGAPKLPRSRDKRAASVDSPPYNPLIDKYHAQNRIQFDNPSSLMATRGKKAKRKILLSKAMNNMNNVKNMNKRNKKRTSPMPFNKQNVNITPPSQSIYNRDTSPSPSPYDISPYSSDKSKNRLPPKKLFNEVNTNEQRKTNYTNLRNRRTPKDNNNNNNNNNNNMSAYRRQKKNKQKRKSFKVGQFTQNRSNQSNQSNPSNQSHQSYLEDY